MLWFKRIWCLVAFLIPLAGIAEEISFETFVKRIINQKSESVADSLGLLPKAHLSNWTLMRESGSLQPASPENPRAILYGETGRLIVTFNGVPEQGEGYSSLETAEVDSKTKKILFREIFFKNENENFPRPTGLSRNEIEFESDSIVVSKANPKKCLACHSLFPGADLKRDPKSKLDFTSLASYNWSGYSFWKGAYGAIDDRPGRRECEALDQWRAGIMQHPRYSKLVVQNEPCFPFVSVPADQIQSIKERRNLLLTKILGLNHIDQLSYQIQLQLNEKKQSRSKKESRESNQLEFQKKVLKLICSEPDREDMNEKLYKKSIQKPDEILSAFFNQSSFRFHHLMPGADINAVEFSMGQPMFLNYELSKAILVKALIESFRTDPVLWQKWSAFYEKVQFQRQKEGRLMKYSEFELGSELIQKLNRALQGWGQTETKYFCKEFGSESLESGF